MTAHSLSGILLPALALLGGGGCAQPVAGQLSVDGQQYTLSFADEFEGDTLHSKRWEYRTDSKHWSTQLPANVQVDQGCLLLHTRQEQAGGKAFTGAGIISRQGLTYGYYEAGLQVPPGAGWHSSFWLMRHNGSGSTDPALSRIEIDIFENDSKDADAYSCNLHLWQGGHVNTGSRRVAASGLDRQYYTLACAYLPDSLHYYRNGERVHSRSLNGLPADTLNIWLTSIASPLGGTQAVDTLTLPAAMQVDYVRYYRWQGIKEE